MDEIQQILMRGFISKVTNKFKLYKAE
jgi:hypothetical protein